jgi:mycolic acid cyclopropane synthetase
MRKGQRAGSRESEGSEIRLSLVMASLALCFLLWLAPARAGTPPRAQAERSQERLAPFVPTPLEVVEKMLELAQVGPDDVVYDLGSGDGRIVIMAAQKFGARAVGVELNGELFKQSSMRIAELGLEKRAKILYENMFEVSVRPATVVTLYLLTVVNEKLRPKLEKELGPGTRVVSHDFKVPGWTPKKVVDVTSKQGLTDTIYLYVRP